jgi:hypothetical protein
MNDTLPADAIERLTGYSRRRPSLQLLELHRQGFWRARRARVTGEVILERPHYDAIASGQERSSTAAPTRRPKVRTPQLAV